MNRFPVGPLIGLLTGEYEMKTLTTIVVLLLFITVNASAQVSDRDLQANPSFLAEPARMVNQANYQGAQIIKSSLKGKNFSIPKTWRLVNAVPSIAGSPGGGEYVLFFQDAVGAVHTIGVQTDGSVSGNNVMHIPSY